MASEMIRERESAEDRARVAAQARRLQEIPALWAAMRPDAIVLADAGREFSWSELQRGVQSLARRLQALGVRPGDRVMIVAENCAPMVALLFAVVRLDAWVVIVNARLSAREINAIRAHCGDRARRQAPVTSAYFASRPSLSISARSETLVSAAHLT